MNDAILVILMLFIGAAILALCLGIAGFSFTWHKTCEHKQKVYLGATVGGTKLFGCKDCGAVLWE